MFICRKCGHKVVGENCPESCPDCGAGNNQFSVIREEIDNSIPDYWQPMLDEKIGRIHKLQAEAGRESPSFGLITDIHWSNNEHHSAALMKEVLDQCGIPYFYNAGDIVSGYGLCVKEFLFEELDSCRRSFSDIEHKCLIVEGNHDSAYSTLEAPNYYAENISAEEVYEHLFRFETIYPDRVFGPTGTYYYVDDKFHKMRYVVLNSHDIPSDEKNADGLPVYDRFRTTAVRQEQMEWFANVALDVPSTDWTVSLCTHENLLTGWEFYGGEIITGILNAFKNHAGFEGNTNIGKPEYEVEISVDFTGRGGEFTAWVCGHFHESYIEVINGIVNISTHSDSLHQPEHSPYKRIPGTDSEHAFDIFTIDKRKRKIFITRIGAGEDREVEY